MILDEPMGQFEQPNCGTAQYMSQFPKWQFPNILFMDFQHGTTTISAALKDFFFLF